MATSDRRTQLRRGKLILLLLLFLAERKWDIKSFFDYSNQKIAKRRNFLFKNVSNHFGNGDNRPENTAGIEVTQVRRGKLKLLLLLFLAERKWGNQIFF
jgi:hypothetical protein